MASDTDNLQRSTEAINVTVLKAKHLRGSKGDSLTVTIKLEFGDKVIGESAKLESAGDSSLECNFSVNLSCNPEDPVSVDEITHKPVVLTVTEVFTKEKKQKEEKTNIIGQCCIDLIPLIKGSLMIKQTLTLHPLPGSPLELIAPDAPKPEVDIKVTVNQALLDESRLSQSNLLTLSIGSLYSPPESWTLTGQQYFFNASMPVPISHDREVPITFNNGLLKVAQEKDLIAKQKKWASPGTAHANAAVLPDRVIFSDPIDDEDGDLKGKDDRDLRTHAETEKNRVTWNMERRCFLDSSAVKWYQETIARKRFWPLEIFRIPQPQLSKGKKEEDTQPSFHGVAFLNLAPLLYPGVDRVRGAYKVVAYTEHAVAEKTKRKPVTLEDRLAQSSNRVNNSPAQKKGAQAQDKKDGKKGATDEKQRPGSIVVASNDLEPATGKSETLVDSESQLSVNIEGQQYVDARSYIMVEICLDKPLVPKRPPEQLAKRVAELIPPRPIFPKRTEGSQKAVEDYHTQVASVANLILEEFRDLFGDEIKDEDAQTSEDIESRRQKLIYELNASGKYFAFKEQLKHSVVKIVREKYLRTTGFDDRQQLQTFLSELYVYLIDQMHVSLGHVLALEDQPPVPKPLTDSSQLKHFAREAEVNQNFTLAATYYKERIARDRGDADCWFDFGTFNLYIHDIPKAEECFKECIAINQKHIHGLMLYGLVCMLTERIEMAETFFEAATCVDNKSILAWTMLGLFYDAVPNEIGAEMAYIEANKLNTAKILAQREEEKRKEEEAVSEQMLEPEVETTEPAQPLSDRSKTSSLNKKGQPDSAGANKPPSAKPSMSRPSSQKGMTVEPPSDQSSTRDSILASHPSIYMQAVDWLLQVKAVPFTERALGHELVTCSGGPSAAYNICLARLRLQKGEYREAEECLTEALQTEFQNPDAWALLGHVKYLTSDLPTARDCYERTLSFVTDASETHSIYLRLASIYLQEERFHEAKNTFLLACKKSPSCISWLGVGIACYRLNELAEAEDALSEANVLNNNDPEVWAYLSLVCLQTNRQLEAEQAYKYAVKLNLDDGALLAEIHREQVSHGFGNPAF
ncbi:cilia- and flagella-associated protein 70-like isoform X2 [Physella acuta]|uniref:cilia- and flagella-associated protein 70-like isoform X2 n=1 Tax=Physella acuta TaxID=109671 RepID=UPI0027DCF387|nr:cilia- and flagella-associated protein 70-like isoform X2 [Physella acuta]